MTNKDEIELFEIDNSIMARVPGELASADLSRIDPSLAIDFNLEPGEWFFFNRLINQSGKPGLGTKMLNKILTHCQKNRYSILNQVNAYGQIKQKNLEKWYMSKGFTPLNYKKYKNSALIWRPIGETW